MQYLALTAGSRQNPRNILLTWQGHSSRAIKIHGGRRVRCQQVIPLLCTRGPRSLCAVKGLSLWGLSCGDIRWNHLLVKGLGTRREAQVLAHPVQSRVRHAACVLARCHDAAAH